MITRLNRRETAGDARERLQSINHLLERRGVLNHHGRPAVHRQQLGAAGASQSLELSTGIAAKGRQRIGFLKTDETHNGANLHR